MNCSSKKVLQINVVANSGSTGRIAEEIGELIMANGWECYIAYGRWANPSKSHLYRIESKVGIAIHYLISRFFDCHGLGSIYSTYKLVSYIKKIQPDIIHLHNLHGYYLNYPILFNFLSQTNIPVVWTLHDCWAMTGHCVHFQRVNCNKWTKICGKCPNIYDYPASFVDNSKFNFLLKKKKITSVSRITIVPVCNWLNDVLKESSLKELESKVIPNGIDLNVFKYRINLSDLKTKYSLCDKFVILAIASNWNVTKGIEDVFYLADNLPGNCVLLLVGLTKKQQNEFDKDNIIVIDKTESPKELSCFYSLADVLINPTYQDTFPTVNLEALACGTPVITYDTGGCKDTISDNTGILIERGNKEKMLEAILKIKLDSKSSYFANCQAKAKESFDKKKCYQEYLKLYLELLH